MLKISIILSLIALLAQSFSLSFSTDTLDTLWVTATSISWIVTAIYYVRYKGALIIAITLIAVIALIIRICASAFSGDYLRQVFPFQDRYMLKEYTIILGFTDATSEYRLYQILNGFPILEKYIGTTNLIDEKDNYRKPMPVQCSSQSVIVQYDDAEQDTFLIKKRLK